MGLDIYLTRITKPTLDTNKTYSEEELYEKGYGYTTEEEQQEFQKIPDDMLDKVTQQVTIASRYFDSRKLWKEFSKNYPANYSTNNESPDKFAPALVGTYESNEERSYTFEDDFDNTIRLTFKTDDEFADYLKTRELKAYVYNTEEIDYQRKGLNNYGWSLLPENCTYCFDKEVVEQLVEKGGLSETFIENWIDGETALFAWW